MKVLLSILSLVAITFISSNQPDNNIKDELDNAFVAIDYDAVILTLTEKIKTEKTSTNYFLLGMAHLEIGQNKTAIRYLNVTLNNFDNLDNEAQWYLAVAHLNLDNEEEAISNLVSLTLSNSIYKAKAEAILQEMGLTTSSLDYGIVRDVKLRPRDDAPDGAKSSFEEERQIQYGIVESQTDGFRYHFLTDQPIRSLHEGSEVEMIIIRRDEGKKSGFAFILGER